jgi:hypothetical protein
LVPNPSSKHFTVLNLEYKKYSYRLLNVMGLNVLKGKLDNTNQLEIPESISCGIYILFLEEENSKKIKVIRLFLER